MKGEKAMKYLDIESGEIITAQDLLKEWEQLTDDEKGSAQTFGEYLVNCTSKNGTLIPVYETIH